MMMVQTTGEFAVSRLRELARKVSSDPASLTFNEEVEFHRLMASKLDTRRSEERLRLWQDALL